MRVEWAGGVRVRVGMWVWSGEGLDEHGVPRRISTEYLTG